MTTIDEKVVQKPAVIPPEVDRAIDALSAARDARAKADARAKLRRAVEAAVRAAADAVMIKQGVLTAIHGFSQGLGMALLSPVQMSPAPDHVHQPSKESR